MLSARCTHPIRKGQYCRETSHDGLIAASITGLNLGPLGKLQKFGRAEVYTCLYQHCGEPGMAKAATAKSLDMPQFDIYLICLHKMTVYQPQIW